VRATMGCESLSGPSEMTSIESSPTGFEKSLPLKTLE
jgi:hypothetical protein